MQIFREELNGSGSRVGYRRVHRALMRKDLVLKKHEVRLFVKELDLEGVMLRKKRRLCKRKYSNPGASFIWYIDGYDKLNIMALVSMGVLTASPERYFGYMLVHFNKYPNVTAKLNLDTVSEFGGVLKYISAVMVPSILL